MHLQVLQGQLQRLRPGALQQPGTGGIGQARSAARQHGRHGLAGMLRGIEAIGGGAPGDEAGARQRHDQLSRRIV